MTSASFRTPILFWKHFFWVCLPWRHPAAFDLAAALMFMPDPTLAQSSGNASLVAWYCLRSQPKHEHIAAIHLRRYAAVEVFAPRIRFQRPRLKGKAWMTEALFPGYLFARFDLAERWREIQYSHAVRSILSFGGKIPVLPTEVIDRLREMLGPEELSVVQPAIEAGGEIVVTDGVFQGLKTIVTSYVPGKDRIKLLMNVMGRDMEVEAPLSSVIPAKTSHPLASR